MPRHLGLKRRAFLAALSPELPRRYLERLQIQHIDRQWLHLNPDALDEYLDDDLHAEQAALILEDLQKVNDICEERMGLVVRAYQKFHIPTDDDWTDQERAMRLFLDHAEAFDFAYSLYLLSANASRMSHYYIPVDSLAYGPDEQEAFRADVARWFTDEAKGRYSQAFFYDEHGDWVVHIRHGAHVRAVSLWEEDQISTNSYRPAVEDVLVYESDRRVLRIKAASQRDRDEYLRLWCRHIAGDERLADGDHTNMFDLTPLQDGRFSFGGDGIITKVELCKVKLQVPGVSRAELTLKAGTVAEALRYDLPEISLERYTLRSARLRFHIRPPHGRSLRITFEIEPPQKTSLPERGHADVILRYLQQQGVLTR